VLKPNPLYWCTEFSFLISLPASISLACLLWSPCFRPGFRKVSKENSWIDGVGLQQTGWISCHLKIDAHWWGWTRWDWKSYQCALPIFLICYDLPNFYQSEHFSHTVWSLRFAEETWSVQTKKNSEHVQTEMDHNRVFFCNAPRSDHIRLVNWARSGLIWSSLSGVCQALPEALKTKFHKNRIKRIAEDTLGPSHEYWICQFSRTPLSVNCVSENPLFPFYE